MKKLLVAMSVMACVASMCGCSKPEDTLSGTYVSETGTYSIELSEEGTCTWYDDGTSYTGYYVKEEDYWKVYLPEYIDYPEEVMDVQLCPEEDGSMMAYSLEFMEKMFKQE